MTAESEPCDMEGIRMELRLPRLTIERSEDEGFSLGTLSASLIVGFGIHWGWVYLTMLNARSLFFADTADAPANSWGFYTASLCVLVLTLLSYAAFSRPLRRLFRKARFRPRVRFAGALLMATGTLCMTLANVATDAGLIALGAGAITTGAGSCILLMSFGVSFSQCDTATIVTSTALALLVGICVFFFVSWLESLASWGAIACAMLPFVECWCLYHCSHQLVDRLEFSATTLKVHKASFALRICLPSVLFGVALGTVRTGALNCARLTEDPGLTVIAFAAATCAACVLMVGAMLMQRQHLNFMFRAMLPIIATAIAWLTLSSRTSAFATTFVLFGTYVLFESMMWVAYAEIAQRFRISAFIVFGFGRGALAFGTLLGTEFASVLTFEDFLPFDPSMSIIVLTCTIAGFATLPRGSEIRSVVIPEIDADAIDDEKDGREKNAPSGMGESEAACLTSECGATDGDDTARKNEGQRERRGRFKRKCDKTAATYLLSRKETEVLFLLAKGRNAAAIQEALFIAEGTVRTHMRHIYKKLDVHTQQELIDLVESADVD